MADVTNDQPEAAWWWHPTVVGPLIACLVLAAIGGYIAWNDWRTEKAESERRTQEFTCALLVEDGARYLPDYCFDD
jgi:hypothetical protein